MRGIVMWLMVGYVALELLGVSIFIEHFGVLLAVVEVFVSGALGLWLLRRELAQLSLIQLFVRFGQGDMFALLRNSMLSGFGAVFLLIPGIFTDIIGVVMVLCALAFYPKSKLDSSPESSGYKSFDDYFTSSMHYTYQAKPKDDDIIDVEVLEPTSSQKPSEQLSQQSRSAE